MFADYEGDLPNLNVKVNGEIPIFVTRNLVMFPGILTPILVGRKTTLALVKYLEENPETIIALVSQRIAMSMNLKRTTFTKSVFMHASFVLLICQAIMKVIIRLSYYKDLASVGLKR